MIPKVKQWKVTTEDGEVWIVIAPTRGLAVMNFRHDAAGSRFKSIKSIGLVRNPRTVPADALLTCGTAWKEG